MQALLPRLRDDVVIQPYDGGLSRRYIAAVDGRHFLLSETVAVLLELTRRHESPLAVLSELNRRFDSNLQSADIEAALQDCVPEVLVARSLSGAPRSPLLASRRILRADWLRPILKAARGLFHLPLVFALLALFLLLDIAVAVEVWRSGLAALTSASAGWAAALVVIGVLLHEIGHLAACHRFGADHGGIGIGLYWGMPVFYAEVHGAWLLKRSERALVDVGGVYFQCLYLGVLAGAWLVHPSGTLFAVLWLSHFLILNTLNPVLKYDGYWLLSDLSGRHNLHESVRRTAARALCAARHRSTQALPPRPELLLLGGFLLLAVAYFSYVFVFLAHNVAYAASALAASLETWSRLLSAVSLLLLIVAVAGISLSLAKSINGILQGSGHAAP